MVRGFPMMVVPSAMQALLERLTLFRRHLHPALCHAVAPMMAVPMVVHAAEAAEEDPAQDQQPEGLPVAEGLQAEDRRHQPVPQAHGDVSEQERGERAEYQEHDALQDPVPFASAFPMMSHGRLLMSR